MEVLRSVDAEAIRALHSRDEFFWLDLEDPAPADLDRVGALCGIPGLAIEDSAEFGQRPKIDDYADRVLVVFYGAHEGRLVEVHVHVSGREVITVRREPCDCLHATCAEAAGGRVRDEVDLVFRILDALGDSLASYVDALVREAEGQESMAFESPADTERRRIAELRGELFQLELVVEPQRDMMAGGARRIECVPGLEGELARHPFREVHDNLVLTTTRIRYGREVLAEALSILLAATSNRLNRLATRVSLIATIFLPLTFVTGFFGQNFGWLVDHIDSFRDFLLWGMGGVIVPTLIGAAVYARARRLEE